MHVALALNRVPGGTWNRRSAIGGQEGVIASSNYAIAPPPISCAWSCSIDRLGQTRIRRPSIIQDEIFQRDQRALHVDSSGWCGQASDSCSIHRWPTDRWQRQRRSNSRYDEPHP
jgi:hypothetical protein